MTEASPLKKWIRRSREAENRDPNRFLSAYDLKFDSQHVWMTQSTYDAIVRNCGVYNGIMPTAEYCGKIFLRNGKLMWFGINKEDPTNPIKINSRAILIKPSGPGPAVRVIG